MLSTDLNKKYTLLPFQVYDTLKRSHSKQNTHKTINEGKNREIRKIFEFLGYKVIDLERISVGSVHKFHAGLGTLEAGHTKQLGNEEIAFFFKQKEKMDLIIKENPIKNMRKLVQKK